MSPTDALWHALNFFAPMLAVGALVALLAKTFWRGALRATSSVRLVVVGSAAASISYGGAVAWFARDGAMAAYAVMLISTALAVGWVVVRSRAR